MSSSSSTSAAMPPHNRALHSSEEQYGGIPPLPVMERVLFQLHHRSCQFGLRFMSGSTRRLLEHLLLVVAIGGFGALFLLHRHFVLSVGGLGAISHPNAATQCFMSIPGMDVSAHVHRVIILPAASRIIESPGTLQNSYVLDEGGQEFCAGNDPQLVSFSFSTTKAFLMLPTNHTLFQDNIVQSQTLVVAPQDPNCFGEPFLQYLIHNLVGYETIVWNWSLGHLYQLSEAPQKGYVLSHKKGRIQELELPTTSEAFSQQDHRVHRWLSVLSFRSHNKFEAARLNLLSKLSVVIKTTFLFLFCSTLISFTLRETQERMLEFTQELSRRVSIQLPLVDLIVFHLIHNLIFVPIMVGMMFFLIEFYSGDRLLAFLVMSIVWCVEVFSVISLRSYQGITFFPRMFFLLFSLFHIYFFANPYGFAYAAMGVVGLFMLHSMAFFWHRYELPAVASGRVTIDRPRQHYDDHRASTGGGGGIGSLSMWTPVSSPGRNGQRGMEPRGAQPLHPQSPPQIRPAQGRIDFEPVNRAAQSTTTSGQPTDHSSLRRVNAVDRNPSQQPSFSSQVSSSSRSNSVNSIHNVIRDDDEDSSSYVYFMQGEVVFRRGRGQNGVSAPSAGALVNVESAHTLASTVSGQDLQQQHPDAPPLVVMSTQHPLGSFSGSVGLDLLEQHDGQCPDTIIYSSPPTADTTGSAHSADNAPPTYYGGEDSKSGLQSILEVRLTPRHRNGEEPRGNPRSSPPIFPNLPP